MYNKRLLITFRQRARIAMFIACTLFLAACHAIDAKVTDVSGRTYEVKGIRLAKGSALDVNCGGVRVKAPFKSVKTMKINPAKITSIDGRLYFSVELQLQDSTVLGGTESGGRCYVLAGNGLKGKSSKAGIYVPFNKLGYVYILGKEDKENKAPAGDGDGKNQPAGDGKTPPAADEKEQPADNEEKQPEPESNDERRTEE